MVEQYSEVRVEFTNLQFHLSSCILSLVLIDMVTFNNLVCGGLAGNDEK